MASRAEALKDLGASSPQHREKPLGSAKVHVVLVAAAPSSERRESAVAQARQTYRDGPGVRAIWRQDCHALPTGKEPFGYLDGVGQPAIEGSPVKGSNSHEAPLKA